MINVARPPIEIAIGFTGESDFRRVEFDVSLWVDEYPDGEISIYFERPDGVTYAVEAPRVGAVMTWLVSETDVAVAGVGKVELRIYSDGIIGKRQAIRTVTRQSLGEPGDVPSPPPYTPVAVDPAEAARVFAAIASRGGDGRVVVDIEKPPVEIPIGITGENDFRLIEFDVSAWRREYPEAGIAIIYQRPDGAIYPVSVAAEDSFAFWLVSDVDVAVAGNGAVELHVIGRDFIGKSAVIETVAQKSLGTSGVAPDPPPPDWVDTVAENARKAEAAVGKMPYIGENGNWFEWDAAAETFVDTGVPATPEPVTSHSELQGRDEEDQHPIEAITGLTEALEHAQGDKFFVFTQRVASDTWHIPHGLGKYPAVSVVDSAGNLVVGSVLYLSPDELSLTFCAPFSGKAYLN